jgi:hypothetical protein
MVRAGGFVIADVALLVRLSKRNRRAILGLEDATDRFSPLFRFVWVHS